MMKKITFNPIKRAEIIMFIADYLDKNGKCPTLTEIGKGVGLKSKSGVWHHLEIMGLSVKGDKMHWRNNKKQIEREMTCPTCQRPLFGTIDEWEKAKLKAI